MLRGLRVHGVVHGLVHGSMQGLVHGILRALVLERFCDWQRARIVTARGVQRFVDAASVERLTADYRSDSRGGRGDGFDYFGWLLQRLLHRARLRRRRQEGFP